MKLSIERTALLRSLGHVQNVVERRGTIPILNNVKLEAVVGRGLELVATDLDLTLIASEDVQVDAPGVTTVPAHTFFEIVRKLPEGSMVSLTHLPEANELLLQAGRSQFALPCLPTDDFPVVGSEPLDVTFSIPPSDLIKIVDKVRFAISTEETRYYLNGIHLHTSGTGATRSLRGVSTDGHRLARVEVPLPDGAESLPPVIVPRKTVGEVRKLVDGASEDVKIDASPIRIQFTSGRAILISRLIDGTFPDYERVIPPGNENIAVIPTKTFGEAVDRVATISVEKARPVKLAFAPGKVTVSAVSPELGRAVEELDADYRGDPIEIGFNARYVLDMVAQINGPELQLEMASAVAPTVVRDLSDPAVLFVLMPMRV